MTDTHRWIGIPAVWALTLGWAGSGWCQGVPDTQATRPVETEQALFARILELAEDPPTGSREEYAAALLARRQELIKLADALLQRYPQTAHRDQALESKLQSMYLLATVGGQDLEPLRRESQAILAAKPSPELGGHAAYWALRAEVVGKRGQLRADEKLDDAQRAAAYRSFVVERMTEYVRAYPTSEFAPEMLAELIKDAQDKGESEAVADYVARLKKQFPDHMETQMVEARLRRRNGVGKPFPLAFTAVDGRKVDTAQMRGKVILVDFFASWCPPCRAAVPHLKQLYEKHHAAGLEIIGVSVDQSREDLDRYLHDVQRPWATFVDLEATEKLARSWAIETIPAYFVVDRNGLLRSTDAGSELDELIPKLLEEKAPQTQP
jgi:thiol-disulfide isomerase/thioredoxin